MTDDIYDILIVGGGVNGAGIAHYASLYGLKVYLCEKDDFASKTSSCSTKLLHGGLRYLENYEFNLVRSALQERNKLYDIARHIVRPLDFVLIHNPQMRHKWLVRIGLFIYDLLAGFTKKFKSTKTINLFKHNYGRYLDLKAISKSFKNPNKLTAFIYNDLWVDDARLTVLNVVAACQAGATVHKNTELMSAEYNHQDKLWKASLKNNKTLSTSSIKAKLIINATGPWVNEFLINNLNLQPRYNIRLVKGSHLVVPQLYSGDQCYVLQNVDQRLIFIIPYQDKYTLIGTTETEDIIAPEDKAKITPSETDYLIAIANKFLDKKITAQDAKWSYSGIRPLLDSGESNSSKNTRDYYLENYNASFNVSSANPFNSSILSSHISDSDVSGSCTSGPLINIYGGKITTYRVLALKLMNIIKTNYRELFDNKFKHFDPDKILLPGSDILNFSENVLARNNSDDVKKEIDIKWDEKRSYDPDSCFNTKYPAHLNKYIARLQTIYPWLSISFATRLATTYGSKAEVILTGCKNTKELGIYFGADLYSKEVDYLIQNEFADCIDDILWRRTKLGLELSCDQMEKLGYYLISNSPLPN